MLPGHERQPPAVRARPRIGDEVAGLEQHLAGVARSASEPHHGVLHIRGVGVVLAHHDQAAARQGRRIGVAVPFRRQGLGPAPWPQGIKALVREIGEIEHPARRHVGRAAIFVNARADRDGRGGQRPGLIGVQGHGHDTAAVGRAAFQPVEAAVIDPEVQRIDRPFDQALEGDRRGPGSAGSDRFAHRVP